MSSFLDLVHSVTENVTFPRWRPAASLSLIDLAKSTFDAEGYDQTRSYASAFWELYELSSDDDKLALFSFLDLEMAPDVTALTEAVADYASQQDAASLDALNRIAEAPRRELFRRLNQARNGTQRLVLLRQDLLTTARDLPDLVRVDVDLKFLLKSWFNLGVLELRPLNWKSPAHILEKLIKYEAVHQIDSWAALRGRTEPADRRCFGYFHPSMPDEPLIFVQVALGPDIPNSIDAVLAADREICSSADAEVATFYSISNCQDGLAGISFGNFLIKQVVKFLQLEFDGLETFVTLSPIPGLGAWAEAAGLSENLQNAPEDIRRAAAYYLCEVKNKSGHAKDPVARFHLGNGARVHAVHENADLSEKGQAQSFGAMVNYLYDLDDISKNHHDYVVDKKIARSKPVAQLSVAGQQKFS
ncbi:MAG: malonyl-CoA decarboxylase family protein [Pseudomonadota bacterium]